MAEPLSSRLLMPGVALVAFGLAAAAYLVPIPALNPATITGSPIGATPFPEFERQKDPLSVPQVDTSPKEWTTLVEGLDRLRDKPAVPPPEAVAETPAQPAVPSRIPLDWRYIGFAGTPQNPSAFVTMSGLQRVVFVNQVIPDLADPSNTDGIVVRSIEPHMLTVSRGRDEESFKLIDRETGLSNRPGTSGRPPFTSSALPRPISNPGGAAAPGLAGPPGTNRPPTNPGTPGIRAR